MKRCLIFYLFSLGFTQAVQAQKPLIDTNAFNRWTSADQPVMSNDGRYAAYNIQNEQAGGSTLVIRAVNGAWEKRVVDGADAKFSDNSTVVGFKIGDSLGLITVNDPKITYVPAVSGFEFLHKGKRQYIGYQTTGDRFCLKDIGNGSQSTFDDVKGYHCNEENTALILEMKASVSDGEGVLQWVDLSDRRPKSIFQGSDLGGYVFQKGTNNVCFLGKDRTTGDKGLCLWYYREGMAGAQYLTCDSALVKRPDLHISRIVQFNDDGTGVIFACAKKLHDSLIRPAGGGWVYSFTDGALISAQLKNFDSKGIYLGPFSEFKTIVWISDRRVVNLEGDADWVDYPRYSELKGDSLLLTENGEAGWEEHYWNKKAQQKQYLISLRTGERRLIDWLPDTRELLQLSPTGKYLVWYDQAAGDYFSYELGSGQTRNITNGAKVDWSQHWDRPGEENAPTGVVGYVKGDDAILLYSCYGIYKADLSGKDMPVNLTKLPEGEGTIRFGPVIAHDDFVFGKKEQFIVNAFNLKNKENGFYRLSIDGATSPERLTMKAEFFMGERYRTDLSMAGQAQRIKAANVYMVRRMSATESPNYFLTADFRSFTPITDVHPERNYNWLTTELVTWPTTDGSLSQGVLYKPENFDAHKKYPIIFYYYEIVSDGLHKFVYPGYSIGPMNIAEYVSNGYLVFTPDIHFKIGYTGNSVLNSVVSAAQYLSRFPYIDSARMGIQGHSFGGFSTFFLVTHSTLFKAAVAAEGATDMLSEYSWLNDHGETKQSQFEVGQYRIGANPWESPELYLQNSAIFNAHKVTTPLLILDNIADPAVSFDQGMGFFAGLRRLGKPAWLLQYDGQQHIVYGDASRDYTIRMRQFFDHYLKGAPWPKWMVEPIPAIRQGIDRGYELEPAGTEPRGNLLTPEAQKKAAALMR